MMTRISEHHRAKCGIEGKCSVPIWQMGGPSGFCDAPATSKACKMSEMLAFPDVSAYKGGVAARQRPTPDQRYLGVAPMPKPIRPVRIEGNLAYVTLTQGYNAVIDATDAPLVVQFNWCAAVGRNTVYAKRTDHSGSKSRLVLMHRIIVGDPKGLEVDHRDGDGLNNRRSNLREATKTQNRRNQRTSRANTSGFKGVSYDAWNRTWQAGISINGKSKRLGSFPTPEAAYVAYCKASAELHGEFGRVA